MANIKTYVVNGDDTPFAAAAEVAAFADQEGFRDVLDLQDWAGSFRVLKNGKCINALAAASTLLQSGELTGYAGRPGCFCFPAPSARTPCDR